MTENEIAKIIVDAAIEVHRELGGPGLLEDVYEEAMAEELRLRGLKVERQLPVWINYKGRSLEQTASARHESRRVGAGGQQSRDRVESNL